MLDILSAVGVVVLIMGGIIAIAIVPTIRKIKRLEREFGFVPISHNGIRDDEMSIINGHLGKLAVDFHIACDEENAMWSSFKNSPAEHAKLANDIAAKKLEIAIKKRAFWRAHKIIKDMSKMEEGRGIRIFDSSLSYARVYGYVKK